MKETPLIDKLIWLVAITILVIALVYFYSQSFRPI